MFECDRLVITSVSLCLSFILLFHHRHHCVSLLFDTTKVAVQEVLSIMPTCRMPCGNPFFRIILTFHSIVFTPRKCSRLPKCTVKDVDTMPIKHGKKIRHENKIKYRRKSRRLLKYSWNRRLPSWKDWHMRIDNDCVVVGSRKLARSGVHLLQLSGA